MKKSILSIVFLMGAFLAGPVSAITATGPVQAVAVYNVSGSPMLLVNVTDLNGQVAGVPVVCVMHGAQTTALDGMASLLANADVMGKQVTIVCDENSQLQSANLANNIITIL